VEQICAIAEELRYEGYFDRIVYLRPGDPLLAHLTRKYLRNVVRETHDYGGCALTAYLAALELPRTRYVVHYDGDMLLYQKPGFDWVQEALGLLAGQPKAVAATPRISPPFRVVTGLPDAPSLHEARPLAMVPGGWRNDWFSTRCFLMDLHRLADYLPLLQGWTLLEVLAVKYLRRGYPRSPEMMMFKRISRAGGWRLNLSNEDAWLLHPATKPEKYIQLLPEILNAVGRGEVPNEQRGYADIKLPSWESFLDTRSAVASQSSSSK
jgi:hypothetical protein